MTKTRTFTHVGDINNFKLKNMYSLKLKRDNSRFLFKSLSLNGNFFCDVKCMHDSGKEMIDDTFEPKYKLRYNFHSMVYTALFQYKELQMKTQELNIPEDMTLSNNLTQ